jgi:hypothetical protein
LGLHLGCDLAGKDFHRFFVLPFIWILGFHTERVIDLLRKCLMQV